MASIGQIVYNVDGVLNTKPSNTENYTEKHPDSDPAFYALTHNIIATEASDNEPSFIGYGQTISRLSIQAEPGIKIQINEGNEILIGRTGIYELDERIQVTKLRIVPITKYKLNEKATNDKKIYALQNLGKLSSDLGELIISDEIKDILKSDTFSDEQIKKLADYFDSHINGEEAENKYQYLQNFVNNFNKTVVTNFNTGYIAFLQGKNGIYEPQQTKEKEIVYETINNLIIDYVTVDSNNNI